VFKKKYTQHMDALSYLCKAVGGLVNSFLHVVGGDPAELCRWMPAEHRPADHVYAERLKHLGWDGDVNGGARGEVFANMNADDAVGLVTHEIDLGVVDDESVVADNSIPSDFGRVGNDVKDLSGKMVQLKCCKFNVK
jgi:hypothetical protein